MKKILFIAAIFISFQSFGQADKILTKNGTTIDTTTILESQARAVNRAALKVDTVNSLPFVFTSLQNNDFLKYDFLLNKWKNFTPVYVGFGNFVLDSGSTLVNPTIINPVLSTPALGTATITKLSFPSTTTKTGMINFPATGTFAEGLYWEGLVKLYSTTVPGVLKMESHTNVGQYGQFNMTVNGLGIYGKGNVQDGLTLYSGVSSANANIILGTNSANNTTISRNINDANTALVVDQKHASSTGRITAFSKAGSILTSINNTGSLVFETAGTGVQIKSGSNQRAGNATLVGGTVTVANTTITANTLITLTKKTNGGTIGTITYTLSAGTSFTITSDSASDTSTYTYILTELN